MSISHITQKQKPTWQLTRRPAIYVLPLLSLLQSSGRKRRFFVAGVLTAIGTLTPVSLYYHASIQTKNSSNAPHAYFLPGTNAETYIIDGTLYTIGLGSLYLLLYTLKEQLSYHRLSRVVSLYFPYNHNIRGSPILS